ncbi:MAG: rhodanese-like domain-containing protein, partial [Salibacteraceae bacterium]
MNNIKFLFLVIPFVFISCSEAPKSFPKKKITSKSEHKQEPSPKVQNISAPQFHKLIEKSSGIILDVRTPGETAQGSIANASFVDINDR